MADFALWVTAAEPSCGWPEGAFLKAYEGNRDAAIELTIEADPVAQAVREFATEFGWRGTASELLKELNRQEDDDAKRQKTWPPDGSRLSGRLRRAAPALRKGGVHVEMDIREGTNRRRMIEIRTDGKNSVPSVLTVHENNDPVKDLGNDMDGRGGHADDNQVLPTAPEPPKIEETNGADGADGNIRPCSNSS